MSAVRHFGFECEVAAGSYATMTELRKRDLIGDTHLHHYHCLCDACTPWRDQHAITGQEDCTVDGELISKVLVYGSDEAENVLDGLSASLLAARAGLSEAAGFHIHVDRRDLTNADHVRLFRMFLRYQEDLGTLASASFRNVRDYNERLNLGYHVLGNQQRYDYRRNQYVTDPGAITSERFWTDDADSLPELQRPPKGAWLAAGHPDTFEFRLWNQSLSRWRMRTHIGVSVAMVMAAKAGVNVTENDPREFIDVIGDHLDTDTLAGVIRQSNLKERHA